MNIHTPFWSSTILHVALHTPRPPLTSVLYYADGENGEKAAEKSRLPQESKEIIMKGIRGERERNLGLEEYFQVAAEKKMRVLGNICP